MSHTAFQQAAQPSAAAIREQVHQQVEAARQEAQMAREQARAAVQAATAGGAASGTPVTIMPPPFPASDVPPGAVTLGIAFFVMLAVVAVFNPLARAWARRMERRGPAPAIDPALREQLQRIEQAVDTMAIEVERISEAQRYMARLESARGAEPAALAAREQIASR